MKKAELTAAQRSLWGRVGAAVARSRHDPHELTREARRTFLERFEAQVRVEHPGLSDAEVSRRAGELRSAYFLRLSARSSIARAKKKDATADHGDAQEVRHASATTTS